MMKKNKGEEEEKEIENYPRGELVERRELFSATARKFKSRFVSCDISGESRELRNRSLFSLLSPLSTDALTSMLLSKEKKETK